MNLRPFAIVFVSLNKKFLSVTDIQVPIRITTKCKLCFQSFSKFQGTNCPVL